MPGVSHARDGEIGGFLGLPCPRCQHIPWMLTGAPGHAAHTSELWRHFLCELSPHQRS
jgi:hypothetical protein